MIIFLEVAESSFWSYFENEKNIDTPTMNRKNGKTISVGVAPCHLACKRGEYTEFQEPGVLTSIMKAIVIPRNTSNANSRLF